MPYLGVKPADEFSSKDLNGEQLILDADADTTITADTDDQIDIRIAGADDFQFTANTFTAQSGSTIAAQALTATTLTGSGVLSIDDATDSTSGTSGSIHTDGGLGVAKDIYVGSQITTQLGSAAAPAINTSSEADSGIFWDSDGRLGYSTGGGSRAEFQASILHLADTANANMSPASGAININQTDYDNEIIALKSSDVAHGMTDDTETDTYFRIKKSSATAGAPDVVGLGEGTQGIRILGQCVTADTAKSTSATAPVILRGLKKSSATNAAMGTNENVVVIEGCTAGPGFIFDAEGSMHSNAANAVYDAFDDAELVRTIDQSLPTKGLIASKFDEFVQYSHEDLADAGLVGRDDDGTPNGYVNWMHLSKLHNGAIWQQHEKHANLLNAVYELAVEAVGEDKADEILDKHDIKLLSKHKLIN